MFNTIKTWVHRIKDYDNQVEQLRISEKMYYELGKENNRQRRKISNLKKNIEEWKHESDQRYKALVAMANILSEGTWKEGDNMMEAIETAQERKYLKQHGEDFLMIMNGNVPEMAARELFEYFEVEVPETNIEDKTARSMHHLWCNWYLESFAFTPGKENKALHKTFEELSEKEKNKFREDARYLWYTGHQQ